MQTELEDRTQEQSFYLRMHLKSKVPFFANYIGTVLENICRVLKQRVYKKDQRIVRKGDYGEEMFVILTGEVGIYLDKNITNCAVTLKENQVFGEASLQ